MSNALLRASNGARVEDAFWREQYRNETYYSEGRSYDFYAPAYRVGWEGRTRHEGRSFVAGGDTMKSPAEAGLFLS